MAVLITGISGQDGSYLAEQLLASGQQVVGIIHPREKLPDYFNTIQSHSDSVLHPCDVSDPAEFRRVLRDVNPEKVFHLAAVSSPAACEDDPAGSRQVNVIPVEVLDDWSKRSSKHPRILVISSAAIFGHPAESPQSECTPAKPVNEYGRQKLMVRDIARASCDSGRFMACAIAYNHESPRRPESFVISKIVNSAARIKLGLQERLLLGNLQAVRDWGYAPEFVTAYSWMLDIERPTELVISTGEGHTVSEAVDVVFNLAELNQNEHVSSNPEIRSVVDPVASVGEPAKAWQELGWEAETKFEKLLEILFQAAFSKLST